MKIPTYVIKNLFLFSLISFLAISCGDDDMDQPEDECNTESLTYTNYAKALINQNCALSGCHSSDAPAAIGSLASYQNVLDFVWLDRLEGAIKHDNGFSNMPKNGDKLDDCDIDKILAWVSDGLPE